MLDTGVRFAASFLPAGVAIIVGIVLAVARRRVQPAVARPALAGLVLYLVAVLLGTLVAVLLPALLSSGTSVGALSLISSIVGLVVAVATVFAWVFLLVALFRRLPATGDRTPTGRHALVDEQGDQVVAEGSMNLYPTGPVGTVGAGTAGMGAAFGTGAFADTRESGDAFPPGTHPDPADPGSSGGLEEPRTEVVPVAGRDPDTDTDTDTGLDDDGGEDDDRPDVARSDAPRTGHDEHDAAPDREAPAEVADVDDDSGEPAADAGGSRADADDADAADDDEPRAEPDEIPEDEVEDEVEGAGADEAAGERPTTVRTAPVPDTDDHTGADAPRTTALGSIDDVDEREQTAPAVTPTPTSPQGPATAAGQPDAGQPNIDDAKDDEEEAGAGGGPGTDATEPTDATDPGATDAAAEGAAAEASASTTSTTPPSARLSPMAGPFAAARTRRTDNSAAAGVPNAPAGPRPGESESTSPSGTTGGPGR